MLKLFFINLFLVAFVLCNAQQRIMFENNKTKEQVIYTLPQTVICVTASGKNKRLVLTNITGDTLHFDDTKDKNQSYFSTFSNIKSIRFLSNWDGVNSLMVASFGTLTIISAFFTLEGLTKDEAFIKGLVPFLIPVAIISGISTYGFNKLLPKDLSPINWKLFTKEIHNSKESK